MVVDEEMIVPKQHSRICSSVVILIIVVLLAGLLVVSSCTPTSKPDSNQALSPAPALGREAPDFTLEDLDGNSIRLNDLRGKVVFLNFWATWCPPCRAEMPDIEEIHQKYKGQDVVILGIDIQESADKVRSFVEDGGYTWTMVLDGTGKVADLYKIRAIPTSFFVDKEGIIRAVAIGGMTDTTMEAKLAEAMK